jgi:hypothetical protein
MVESPKLTDEDESPNQDGAPSLRRLVVGLTVLPED